MIYHIKIIKKYINLIFLIWKIFWKDESLMPNRDMGATLGNIWENSFVNCSCLHRTWSIHIGKARACQRQTPLGSSKKMEVLPAVWIVKVNGELFVLICSWIHKPAKHEKVRNLAKMISHGHLDWTNEPLSNFQI